jgi:hypothetical protein
MILPIANMRIELLNTDFQKLLADVKNFKTAFDLNSLKINKLIPHLTLVPSATIEYHRIGISIGYHFQA